MEHQIGCTLRRAMFEKALLDTLAGFKEEGHVGVDLMELPHEVGHVGEGQDIISAVLGAKGEDWRAEGGKFQPGTEGYYLYPDGSPKKPPRCRAYAEYGFNSGCGCPLPLGHDGDHGGKGEVQ